MGWKVRAISTAAIDGDSGIGAGDRHCGTRVIVIDPPDDTHARKDRFFLPEHDTEIGGRAAVGSVEADPLPSPLDLSKPLKAAAGVHRQREESKAGVQKER